MNISFNDLVASDYYAIWILLAFYLSAIVSYSSYPIIIKISRLKELMQEPGKRSSHIVKTPNLGGIGIFLGIVSVLTFIGSILSYNNLLCFIGSLIVLFFTGIKDDLVELSPIKKLIGQLLASLSVIIITDVRIHSFFGIFGIELLSYTFSVIFTLFVFILLINAFNLIDGVDGLAGSIGITCSLLFGIYFYSNGNDSMLFISVSLIGALSTFLVFNFSKTKKIFMGDTGSMIVGFILAYQAISFLHINHNVEVFSAISNPPALVIAIFSFPLMDTLRVFIIRIIKKRSPFSADRNHIHHNLLSLGLKHWEISLIASLFVLVMAIMTYTFSNVSLHFSILSLIICSSIFSITPYLLLGVRQNFNNNTLSSNGIKIFRFSNKKPKYYLELRKIYNSVLNIII
ncbi:MraY family glycosyltransferase [Flavivirga jejuensis]|uniref:MraY family glycosyltransferase n=1 Tax=Flavivirga jejuensis TaxID=870487 RepID=UPI0031E6A7F5